MPLLQPAGIDQADADARVVFGEEPFWGQALQRIRYRHPVRDDLGSPLLEVCQNHAGQLSLRYADGVAFYIDAVERTIWVTWPATLSREYTVPYLLAPVLGFYLRLRGHLCLHASAVVAGGRALVFMGPAGAGKSTLAAAFAGNGHGVLTDDVACIDLHADGFRVRSGYPSLRVDDRSARLLGRPLDGLPEMAQGWGKRLLNLEEGRAWLQQPVRLGAIFFLKAREALAAPAAIRRMAGREALKMLVANSFANHLLDENMRADEFDQLGTLARDVPVFELALNEAGSDLQAACDCIARHVAQ